MTTTLAGDATIGKALSYHVDHLRRLVALHLEHARRTA